MEPNDVIGWVLNGQYFCVDCPPDHPDKQPIIAMDQTHEWEHRICAACEERLGWVARPD